MSPGALLRFGWMFEELRCRENSQRDLIAFKR
jgi:hypothetical protein